MAMTKLTNLMNPEVMGDWVSEHLEKEMKFSPLCRVDFTLAGRAGDTVTVPKYAYIGDAGEVAEGDAITISQLTASSETVTVKKAGNGVELTDEALLSGYGDPLGEAVRQLKERGIAPVMLTGDNRATAEAIRKQVGIETVISDVLPTEKEAHIRALQEQGHKVAMVGDGINDAPALMRADIGIAIGAGTDIAVDSADVVLMKDSLFDVVTAIELSRSVVRNIHMNLFWAFFYNVLGIPVAAGVFYPAFGLRLSPMIGSAAMSLSSVCVVTNALRLRFFKPKSAPPQTVSKPEKSPEITENLTGEQPESQKGSYSMQKVLKVDGMMCAHCKMHVEQALSGVDGVETAVVDLEKKQATVTLSKDVSDETLFAAVREAGYTPVSCEVL